jgi:hypothetical protein
VDHILTGTLLPTISREVLTRLAEGPQFAESASALMARNLPMQSSKPEGAILPIIRV